MTKNIIAIFFMIIIGILTMPLPIVLYLSIFYHREIFELQLAAASISIVAAFLVSLLLSSIINDKGTKL